jgi:hypothetical protein
MLKGSSYFAKVNILAGVKPGLALQPKWVNETFNIILKAIGIMLKVF